MGELAKKETEASRKKHELVRMRQTVWSQFLKQHWIGQALVTISSLLSYLQEMDIESLEAANQSLQADLKLAFKRIGDLQAAIEDEMESDDNEDLINR